MVIAFARVTKQLTSSPDHLASGDDKHILILFYLVYIITTAVGREMFREWII